MLLGDGDRTVAVGGGDRPAVTVADLFAGGGDEAAVVTAGRHDLADPSHLANGDPCPPVGVEVPGGATDNLDAPVDGVDLVVRDATSATVSSRA